MKETRFISQNKEKWNESENLLRAAVKDPEKLSTLFTQVIDDLSYSRTYYPNRSVRVYLNKIARQYFSIIYGHQKEHRNRFKLFWLDELPQIVIFCRRELIISLLVFLASVAIGVFSAYKDPDFVGTILGDSYVAMTKANIEKGDPMAVYKESHQGGMFLSITINNLRVAFLTYVSGLVMAIGSLAIMVSNGIMVGCFQFFFIERGLFAESALAIWLHGTLEMSSFVIAGGAGLTLGSGLLFPGTYSRLQAFQLSAIRSLKLMLGIAPIIVLAAIIESFLTRYTDVPDFVRLALIILSATLIIGYFVIYPWLKSRRGFEVPLKDVRLPASLTDAIVYTRIKNNAEVVKDTFLLYSRNFNKLFPWIIGVSAIAAVTTAFNYATMEIIPDSDFLSAEWFGNLFSEAFFAVKTNEAWQILVHSALATLILYKVFEIVERDEKKTKGKFSFLALVQLFIINCSIFGLIYLGGWGIFALFITFTLFALWCFTQFIERAGFFYSLSTTWDLLRAYFKQVFEFQVIEFLLMFSFLVVTSAPILLLYTQIMSWNFGEEDEWAKFVILYMNAFIKSVSFYLILPVLAFGLGHLYYSLKEIHSAEYLKQAIDRVGLRTIKSAKR